MRSKKELNIAIRKDLKIICETMQVYVDLVSSMSRICPDSQIGLFAVFSVHFRQLRRWIWTTSRQFWDNKMETDEKVEFLKRKKQLPIVAESRCW